MPTYEYRCEACGAQFEKEQRISEDPIKKCPKCGKAKAQRLISAGNFILKGSGWYADLYHKPAASKASSEDGESSSSGSSSATSTTTVSSDASSTSSTASSDAKPAKKKKAKKA